MATNNFITNTASLKATTADIRKLDVKKINAQTIFLDGENVRDIIDNATPTIKHANDTRENVYENDLWGQWVETKDDGTIVVHDDYLSNPNSSSSSAWLSNVKAVQNNKAYSEITTDSDDNFTGVVQDSVLANIQTKMIIDGYDMFNLTPLTSFSGDLSNLVSGYYMFCNTHLTSFSGNLRSLVNGYGMFSYNGKFESFSGDLSSLVTGDTMFYNTSLESFSSNLSSLTDGSSMFRNTSLTSFDSDLSSLTYGFSMFSSTPLTSFSGDLSRLTNGFSMFASTALTSFNSDLSSLVNGINMFQGCTNLTTFTSDLSSLIITCLSPRFSAGMFSNCTNLTTFTSDLSSLIFGASMFSYCKLSPQSVMYIVESIRNITEEKAKYTSGEIPWVTYDSTTQKYSKPFGFMENGDYVYTYNNPNPYTTTIPSSNVGLLTLGINVTNDSATINQQLQTFAEECLCNSWAELKQEFIDKGWTVTFQYGGTTTSITYGLRDGEQIVPCPIFAKLVQVEDKDSAQYCTEDASTFYNIEWGHDVTDATDYTQFNSLEDAAASWNVFPKENIITEEEA